MRDNVLEGIAICGLGLGALGLTNLLYWRGREVTDKDQAAAYNACKKAETWAYYGNAAAFSGLSAFFIGKGIKHMM